MSAEHRYISDVLHSLRREFDQLKKEMDSFVPRPIEDYADEFQDSLDELVSNNPTAPAQELYETVTAGIEAGCRHQFSTKFSTPTKKLLVTTVFMSHALCEALINQILILRFHEKKIFDQYAEWEAARFLDKWLCAPKSFLPAYIFDKSGVLYGSLRELVKLRNHYTHYKPMVEVDGEVIYGVEPRRRSFDELLEWIDRFISLPYDLALLSSVIMEDVTYRMFLDRGDVPMNEKHREEISRVTSRLAP